MKKQFLVAMTAIGLMAGCATREYHVATLRDLPVPVQHAIREQSPTGDILHVERDYHGGRAIYSVSFYDPVANPPLVIAADGTILGGGRTAFLEERSPVIIQEGAGAELKSGIRLEDLPLAVQRAIHAQAPDAQIVHVDKQMKTGVVYDVQVAEPGATRQLHIAADGSLLEGD